MSASKGPLRIGIVAAESSADQLGVFVIQALRRIDPHCQIEGILGPHMRALGFQSLYRAEDLAVMGFLEVLKKLPKILGIRWRLTRYFKKNPPDLFIGIDAPDFNLTLEKSLRKYSIKTLHYVSPSIWAWKAWRIHKILKATLGVLCLFPFEVPIFEKYQHSAWFVGHPLADHIPLEKPRAQACQALGLDPNRLILAVLPGSRSHEITQLLPDYLKAIALCRAQLPDLQVILPMAHEGLASVFEPFKPELAHHNIQLIQGNAHQVLASADVALATSGTVTLEAMLYKTPMVVAYKLSKISYQIAKRMVKIRYFSLPNIIANQALVPELLQHQVTPEALTSELLALLNHPELRASLQQQFTQLHHAIQANTVEKLTEVFRQYLPHLPQTLILGAGITGQSVIKFLSHQGISTLQVNDTPETVTSSTMLLSHDFLKTTQHFNISQIIASPGFKPSHPVLIWAKEQGIPVYSDIKIFLDHAKAPVIAITGTNGKSTVTTLVGELLKAHGLNVAVGGNLGVPALDLLDATIDVYVMELSSFQLYSTPNMKSLAAAVLNLEPDHLDWHQDLDEYYGAKWCIAQHTDFLVLPHDLHPAPSLSLSPQTQVLRFDLHDTQNLILSKTLQAKHHRANVAAALKLVASFKIPEDTQAHVLKAFPGLPYRCQWIGCFQGVDWYNDSKGTNVGATAAAIRSLKDPARAHLILLLGGVGKGQDFAPLAMEAIGCVKTCIVYGQDQAIIAQSFPQALCVEHLKEAMAKAREISQIGDCVLFSPACASFDQFKNYNERGEKFNQWLHALYSQGA